MREIRTTRRFDLDFARLDRAGLVDWDDFRHFAYVLAKADPLPPEYREHPLTDDWQGFQDAHLADDIVVIFKRFRREVRLYRIGTHTDLFSSRKRKTKGRKRPDPLFEKVLDDALSQAARKIKRWWQRQQ
jgi:mRNA interferase YafQ